MSVLGSEWDDWDDDLDDPRMSTRQDLSNIAGYLHNPNAVVPYIRQNAEDTQESSMSWGDYFDAAWTGAKHGVTTYGPEQLYRAARTIARMGGNLFDTSGIQDWASEGIEANLRARQEDPWYRADPKWMESEWGRSLYQGFSSFTSSMMTYLPAAGLAATGGIASGGVGLGALLFSKMAYLAGSGATSAIVGLSSYDQFLDEAYAAAKEADPTITYDTIASDKFWSAVASGVSESGTEFLGDLAGGRLAGIVKPTRILEKLTGVVGKPAASNVLGVFGRTMRNMTNNIVVELGSEAANAAIQDYIKEVEGMDSQGRIKAMLEIVGPTIVSGALGGVKQTLGGTQDASPADHEAALRQSDVARRRSVLSPEGIDIMERLSADSQDHGQTAFEAALILDAQARRVASESQRNVSDVLRDIDANSPELHTMLQTLRNPDATLSDIVTDSFGQLSRALTSENRQAIEQFFSTPETGLDNVSVAESFQEFLANPDKASEKWNLTEPVKSSFATMAGLLEDSIHALSSDSSVRVNPAAQEYINGRKDYQAPKSPGMRFNQQDFDAVSTRWEGKDLSVAENKKAFLAEALPHMDLDLTAPGAPTDAKGVFRDTFLAYKPLIEKVLAGSKKKSDVTTAINAKDVIDGKPGFELFAETFKAVDGVDDKQAAIKMVLEISESHIKTLAQQIANTDGTGTALEFQAQSLLLNHQVMKDADKGIGRELARALRQRRFSKGDPQFTEKAQAIMNADRKADARKLLWQALANSDDQKSLNHNLNIPLKARTVDAVMEYVTSNMLWGPSTHLVNIMGNTIQMFNKVVERGFGEYLMPQAADGVRRGETVAMVHGFWKALGTLREKWKSHRDESQGFMNAIMTSEDMWDSDAGTKAADAGMMNRAISSERFGLSSEHGAISGGLATMVDMLGKFTHIPFALLNHSDQIFKHVYAQGELDALIVRQAGGDKQRLAELSANPPRDLIKQSQEEAKILMFQGDLDKVSKGLDQMRNAAPILRYFLPFLKTPINVFKEGVSLTPILNRAFGRTRERLNSPDVATRQLAEAHIMLGNLLWTSALAMASQGLLTGPGPEDPRERQKKEATGWQSNSLKLGDSYISLERLDPVALIFNAAAFMTEASDHIDQEDMQKGMLMGIGQAMRIVSDRTYLSSMRDALEFFTMPEKGVPNMLRRIGGSVVPGGSLGRQVNRDLDGFQRESQDFWSGLAQTVPGMSRYLPERRDFLGQRMEAHEYAGPGFLSPFRVANKRGDPVYDEVNRLQERGFSAAPMPGRDIIKNGSRVRMNPAEYGAFLDLYGNGVKVNGRSAMETLQSLVGSNEYQMLPDNQRSKRVRSTLKQFSKEAKKELLNGSPRLNKSLGIKANGWSYLLGDTFTQ